MSTYVIGDVHGCLDDLQRMLERIGFSDRDRLYLVGDLIDRGPQSYEMLRWLESCPENVTAVRGNHDEEFAAYTDLMRDADARAHLESDLHANPDAVALYDSTVYLFRVNGLEARSFFDVYGTVKELLKRPDVTLADLYGWADRIRKMPYYVKLPKAGKDGRPCVITHAGFREPEPALYPQAGEHASVFDPALAELPPHLSVPDDLRDFCLYARADAYRDGGLPGGMVVAGHTPTIAGKEYFAVPGAPAVRPGEVFRFYDMQKDCVFYNIDCGGVFRTIGAEPAGRLACLRLEDEEVFYV